MSQSHRYTIPTEISLKFPGCLDIRREVYSVGLQFTFSPKDQENCESAYNPGGTWSTYFSWTPGSQDFETILTFFQEDGLLVF